MLKLQGAKRGADKRSGEKISVGESKRTSRMTRHARINIGKLVEKNSEYGR